MTQSNVLFLALTCCAVLLCIWAAVSTLGRYGNASGPHRILTLATALLLPPATLATALVEVYEARWLLGLSALLPLLAITAAWCNTMTLQTQPFGFKALHLPVFLFNALLAGIYGVRFAQDLLGVDLGTWGTAVTGGHAMLQTYVGHRDAMNDPIWFHLPLLLPLCLAYRWTHGLALLVCSAVSTVMLALLVTLMPLAYTRAESFRVSPAAPELAQGIDLALGVEVPWAVAILGEPQLRAWQYDLADLEPAAVAFEIRPGVFGQPDLLAQIEEQIAQARRRGLRIIAIAKPGEHALPGDLRTLTNSMARIHWLTAEKLRPDLLVLYTGPFGRLTDLTIKVGTLNEWMHAISRGAAEAKQANPRVRVAVTLESRAPHAAELFRRLRASDSPVDLVGLAVLPGLGPAAEVQAALSTLQRWIENSPEERPVAILETGACPHTTGGELGQWYFLQNVLAFAVRTGARSVVISSLADPHSALGLVARDGHRRLAYTRLRDLLGVAPADPPQ